MAHGGLSLKSSEKVNIVYCTRWKTADKKNWTHFGTLTTINSQSDYGLFTCNGVHAVYANKWVTMVTAGITNKSLPLMKSWKVEVSLGKRRPQPLFEEIQNNIFCLDLVKKQKKVHKTADRRCSQTVRKL